MEDLGRRTAGADRWRPRLRRWTRFPHQGRAWSAASTMPTWCPAPIASCTATALVTSSSLSRPFAI